MVLFGHQVVAHEDDEATAIKAIFDQMEEGATRRESTAGVAAKAKWDRK